MENKFKKQQRLIIGVLGAAGLFFIWVSSETEHSASSLFMGVLLCLASIYNLIFFKKNVARNVTVYNDNPELYKKYENMLKPFERMMNMRLLGTVVVSAAVLVLIVLSEFGIGIIPENKNITPGQAVMFNESDYITPLYKSLENATTVYLENKGPEWDSWLGANTYTCGVMLVGYDSSYIYGRSICEGYEQANTGSEFEPVIKCKIESGSGTEGPIRFTYKNVDSKLVITESSRFFDIPNGGENAEAAIEYKKLFPGIWYDAVGVNFSPYRSVGNHLTIKDRGAEKFKKIYGCTKVEY